MADAADLAGNTGHARPDVERPGLEPPWVGRSLPRVEDAALLTGRGRFIDDLGVRPGTLYAAILRSPHAHADIVAIDVSSAKQAAGVAAVLVGDDVKALTTSLVVGVKAPVECWPIDIADPIRLGSDDFRDRAVHAMAQFSGLDSRDERRGR